MQPRLACMVLGLSALAACNQDPRRNDNPYFGSEGGSDTAGSTDTGVVTTGPAGTTSTTDGGGASTAAVDGSSTDGGGSSTGDVDTCHDGKVQVGELCFADQEVEYAMGTSIRDMTVADFDLDGTLDIATFDYDEPNVYLRLGNGSDLGDPVNIATPPASFGMDSGDFDLDGDIDLVVFGTTLTVVLNDAGTFQVVSDDSPAIITDELNDGVVGSFDMLLGLDVVHDSDVSAYFQRGTLVTDHWEFGQSYALPGMTEGASGLIKARFTWDNGDDDDDIIVLNRDLNFAQVMVANGGGGFQFVSNVDVCPVGSGAYRGTAGDLNADGLVDFVVTCDSGVWSVMLATGDGDFQPPASQNLGTPYFPRVVDVDGDGDLDIGISNAGMGRVEIYLNDGNGAFSYQTGVDANGAAWTFDIADLDGDGAPEVIVAVTDMNVGNLAVFWAQP